MASTSKADDWRSGCSGTISMLDKARQEGLFTDAQFEVGKDMSKKVFNVHKSVLACRSEVFERMFYGPLAEKKNIIKTDDDQEGFGLLMNHFYEKSSKITSLVPVWKLYVVGDKYLVPNILDICKEHIQSLSVNVDDFWYVIDTGVFSHPLFFDRLYAYLKEFATTIIKSKKFLSAQESFLLEFLEAEKLNVNEYDLLIAVTKWGYQNLKPANKESLREFYKYIRFAKISCSDYFQFIYFYPDAINDRCSLEILQYLHTPGGRCLPMWCSSSKVSRIYEFHQENNAITRMQPQRSPASSLVTDFQPKMSLSDMSSFFITA